MGSSDRIHVCVCGRGGGEVVPTTPLPSIPFPHPLSLPTSKGKNQQRQCGQLRGRGGGVKGREERGVGWEGAGGGRKEGRLYAWGRAWEFCRAFVYFLCCCCWGGWKEVVWGGGWKEGGGLFVSPFFFLVWCRSVFLLALFFFALSQAHQKRLIGWVVGRSVGWFVGSVVEREGREGILERICLVH